MKRWQTPLLAVIAALCFTYAAIAVFGVPTAVMLNLLLMSFVLSVLAAGLAGVCFTLRVLLRKLNLPPD